MRTERVGAAALLIGAAFTLAVGALHPSGHDVIHGGGGPVSAGSLGRWVHGAALAATALTFFGYLHLSNRLGLKRPLVQLALICFAMSAAATLIAATISGYVSTPMLERAAGEEGAHRAAFLTSAALAGRFNQGFALVEAAFAAAAVALWALAWTGRSAGAWIMRALGLVGGLGLLAGLFSGHLVMDMHGFLVRVVVLTAFAIGAGLWLWAQKPDERAAG